MATRTKPIDRRLVAAASEVIKTLGHPLRLRILEALEDGEMSVRELTETLGAEQAIVSQQLIKMRGKGILDCHRVGVNVFYGIKNPHVTKVLDCIRHCTLEDFR